MKNLNFELAKCPVCNTGSHKEVLAVHYFNDNILPKIGVLPPYPNTSILKCQKCDHHFSSPQLSDQALDLYYREVNSEYYTDQSYDKLIIQHKQVLEAVIKYKPMGRVLEIGCGYGHLLSLFAKKGWECVGVEPFKKASDFATNELNLNVICGYLDENTFEYPECFDVIMLFDVMEHLKDASAMKKLIDYYLKPGGLVIIGTGDISSINAVISREKWAYLTLREHVSFFSKKSMEDWMNPYSILKFKNVSYAGGVVENVRTFLLNVSIRRLYNLVQSFLYPATGLKVTRFSHVRYLLSFDHMFVIAQKP